MIHFSCDRCKRSIEQDDLRYVVRLEVCAAMDAADESDSDDDRDYLLEIDEILERMDDAQSDEIGADVYQKQRFDLCPDCYRKFIQNPLGLELSSHFEFSDN